MDSIAIEDEDNLWPIADTSGYIVKRIRSLSADYESVFSLVPSGANVRVYPERPVEDCFSLYDLPMGCSRFGILSLGLSPPLLFPSDPCLREQIQPSCIRARDKIP
jgi:hypothetical protein